VPADRLQVARDLYTAYENGDRGLLEGHLADDFTFFSPPDPGLDRIEYFERCWPNAGALQAYELVRLVEVGDDEVLVTYDATRTDGTRFRNTEVLAFAGDKVRRAEVYFGWNLES
jgi:ketosteroid isomerase-like protein